MTDQQMDFERPERPTAVSTSTALVPLPNGAVTLADLFDKNLVETMITAIETHVRGLPADISTAVGRAAIKSNALKIAKSKTALDEAGKDLTEEWKTKSKAVDVKRKAVRDRLDDLKAEYTKPLDDWEAREEVRRAAHEHAIGTVSRLVFFSSIEPTVSEIADRLVELQPFIGRDWQEFETRASVVIAESKKTLDDLMTLTVRRNAERAELQALRDREAARRLDEERRIREQQEKADREAAEQRQREHDELIAREAADRAAAAVREEAERVAQEERDRVAAADAAREAEHQRQLAAAAAEAAERAAQQQRDHEAAQTAERELQRLRDEEINRERDEAAARVAAAEAARREADERSARAVAEERERVAAARAAAEAAEANREHRRRRNSAALAALLATFKDTEFAMSPEAAKQVIAAIASGRVAHVTIDYTVARASKEGTLL